MINKCYGQLEQNSFSSRGFAHICTLLLL